MNWTIVVLTAVIIEFFTVFGRFIFGFRSRDFLRKAMKYFGWKRVFHFHHLFMGLILMGFSIFFNGSLLFSLGLGVALSDVIHHFVVLWIIVGDPEFKVVYQSLGEFEKDEKIEDSRIRKVFVNS